MVDARPAVGAHDARAVALAAREVVRARVAHVVRVQATVRTRRRVSLARTSAEWTGLRAAEPIPAVLALLAALAAQVPRGALVADPIDAAAYAVLGPADPCVLRCARATGASRAERAADARRAVGPAEGQIRPHQALIPEAATAACARSASRVAERDAHAPGVRDAWRGAAKPRSAAVDTGGAVLTARGIEDPRNAGAGWITAPATAGAKGRRGVAAGAAIRGGRIARRGAVQVRRVRQDAAVCTCVEAWCHFFGGWD
jgi:hypothetical protein